ncbi:MAG: hypothetical protein K9G48_08990 [Reyranella sp.]|nr:hypothetical protein [Reyranella sp.]
MEAQRYAVVEAASDRIVNLVMWDGVAAWSPPDGCAAHPYPVGPAEAGWSWDGGKPVAGEEPPPDGAV